MKALTASNITVTFENGRNVLNDLSVEVEAGEFLAVTGPSGCGKSTLLYCLCGIIPAYFKGKFSGNIELLGKNIRNYSRAELPQIVGVVFQNPDNRLFCETVEDEINFGLQNLCLSPSEIRKRAEETMKSIGIDALKNESPSRLSGGQKQLVALAAVLAMQPEILFLDEVMSQVDEAGCELVRNRIAWLKSQGKTIIMVDHNKSNIAIADRVITLSQNGGY